MRKIKAKLTGPRDTLRTLATTFREAKGFPAIHCGCDDSRCTVGLVKSFRLASDGTARLTLQGDLPRRFAARLDVGPLTDGTGRHHPVCLRSVVIRSLDSVSDSSNDGGFTKMATKLAIDTLTDDQVELLQFLLGELGQYSRTELVRLIHAQWPEAAAMIDGDDDDDDVDLDLDEEGGRYAMSLRRADEVNAELRKEFPHHFA